jgi:hypothetical protein
MNYSAVKVQQFENKVIEHVIERESHVDFIPLQFAIHVVCFIIKSHTDLTYSVVGRKKF